MKQYVNEPTHVRAHTLDAVTIQDADNTVSMVEVTDLGLLDGFGKVSRDHLAVIFKAYTSKPAPVRTLVSFRNSVELT